MATKKIIARGAEAIIIQKRNSILKERVPKSYRHPKLDEKLRKLRTRSESKILERASKLIPVPKIISSDESSKTIEMEFLNGKKLSTSLDSFPKTEQTKIAKLIGKNLAILHDAGIIHGDLTTSNMILKNKELFFIDFGLSFHSQRVEDKAVDLHLISEALEAKHPENHEALFNSVIQGYKSSKNYSQVLTRLKKVEKRGRYKQQY